MKNLRLFFFALFLGCFCPVLAYAQGVRYDIPPILTSTGKPVNSPVISLCPGTATISGAACSPATAQSINGIAGTSCPIGSPVTLTGLSTCQATGDTLGNAGFWLNPGAYIYCITGSGVNGACYNLTVPVGVTSGGAFTVTAATISGALTTQSINGDLWVGTGTGQYANIAACIAAASAGQHCNLPSGSESLAASVTLKNQVCIIVHGLYTVTMNGFQIIGPAGVPPCIKSLGLATSTSAGSGANLVLTGYTGTGAVLDIGTAVADTRGGDLEGIFISLLSGGANAIGVRERRFQAAYHNNVVVQGGGTNAATEIGFLLDGTGTFTGNNIYDNCTSNGTLVSIRFIVANLNKINGGNWGTSVGSGIGMDFQNAEGNIIEGIDLESTATALNFANSVTVSNNVFWDAFLQSNTTDVVFGAASKANIIHDAQAGAMGTVTDNSPAGNWNTIIGPAPGFRFNNVGQLQIAGGTAAAPAIQLPNGIGIHQTASAQVLGITSGAFNFFSFGGGGQFGLRSNAWECWTASGDSDGTCDTGISRIAAGVVGIGTGAQGNVAGTIKAGAFASGTNCQLGGATGTASPAACGSAAAGMIAVPASQTSYQVNTTAVTANSEIIVQQMTDNSGLPSSPTCNSGATTPIQSARVAATSFTMTLTSVASVTCFKYWIIN